VRTTTDRVTLSINGQTVTVAAGTVVAAALAQAGVTRFRRSVRGEPRGPLCGMGVCFECRVTLNGQPHSRSCLTLCEDGMEVRTDG
jgi:D-hydroxyproline dehydrogenase subunit gamma